MFKENTSQQNGRWYIKFFIIFALFIGVYIVMQINQEQTYMFKGVLHNELGEHVAQDELQYYVESVCESYDGGMLECAENTKIKIADDNVVTITSTFPEIVCTFQECSMRAWFEIVNEHEDGK